MIDLDELIAEARRHVEELHGFSTRGSQVLEELADALEEVEAERDEWRTEHGIVKERSSTRFQAYQQKKRELRAMEIERDAALARIAELEQSLRSESLAHRVDAALLRVYQGHFAEAAKLHRETTCEEDCCGAQPCCYECGPGAGWPCPTAVALGLNEGEN